MFDRDSCIPAENPDHLLQTQQPGGTLFDAILGVPWYSRMNA
jgi:hypothetical protein